MSADLNDTDTPITRRFLAGRGRVNMTDAEKLVIERSVADVRDVPARQQIVRAGQVVGTSTLLLDGYMCRYMDDREGFRQLVAIHVPGDFVDLHAFPMKKLDHDVASLGAARVAVFDHSTLVSITEQHPRLTRFLWFSTLLDAAQHREWIFRLGRLGAEGRLAHLFLEIEARLAMVGLTQDGRFSLPLIQTDIAEACGLTGVHVNRTLRVLRERELMTFRNGEVEILDRPRMVQLAAFDPSYLYGDERE